MKLKFSSLLIALVFVLSSCGSDDVSSSFTSSTIAETSKVETSSRNHAGIDRPSGNSSSQSSSNKNSALVDFYSIDYVFNNKLYEDEYFNRGGLYNTLYKLHNKEDITVAYMGGSITEMKGWRDNTSLYLERTYSVDVNEVNVSVSGTGTGLGVFRYQNDLLSHNPDLVFIEYASNGGEAEHLEGIIRMTWEHDPTTDICFVYTGPESSYQYYSNGELPPYPAMSEKLAEYYNIPSVFFVKQAFDMYESGQLSLFGDGTPGRIQYTSDKIHPTEEGHRLAVGAIARSILNMEKTFDKESYSIKPHTLTQKTYTSSPFTKATYSTDFSKLKFDGEFKEYPYVSGTEYKNFDYEVSSYIVQRLCKNICGTQTPGSSVTVRFKGTAIGFLVVDGPFSGQLRVSVDGVDKGTLEIYNKASAKAARVESRFISGLSDGEHVVTFTLDNQMPDKSYLKNQFPNDGDYNNKDFYFSRIFLNGTLLDANE